MNETLLITKTCLPRPRGPVVERPALAERLERGLARPLTLLSAPAGFGKTTLLSAWLDALVRAQPDWRVAWLSLDGHDNDPQRFWSYLVAALHSAIPDLAEPLRLTINAPNPPQAALTGALVNALVALRCPLLLVLDDYHLIQSEAVHAGLNELLDRLPENAHLVVATREDPPLALARRRARGELAELRAADLRFSPAEAETFLNTCLGLALDPAGLAALNRRTEGWAVGLQLAAISLRERTPAEQQVFLNDFTGDDQFIFDYLMDEVFQRLTPARQSFLLRTSILERLCAPLCQAVTGVEDAAGLLYELERANLFLQPIDNRRQWYRCHPLFADLLRRRLHETHPQEAIAGLYRHAAEWHEQQGLLREAVAYALAGGNGHDFAATLIERHALELFYHSEIHLVYGWLKALPEATLRRHPLLAAMYANTHVLIHLSPESFAMATHWLAIAEAGLSQTDPPVPFETEAYIAKFRAYLARFSMQPPEEVIRLARYAIERIPPGSARFYSALSFLLGMCCLDIGDEAAGMQSFREAMQSGMASGDWFNALAAVDRLAFLLAMHGNLRQAADLCRQGLEALAAQNGGRLLPICGAVLAKQAAVLVEWNRLEEAEVLLERAHALLALTTLPEGQLAAWLTHARLYCARGDGAGAVRLVQQANAIPKVSGRLLDFQAPFWLRVAGLLPNHGATHNLPLKALDSAQSPAECGPLIDRWGMDLLREAGFEPLPGDTGFDYRRLVLARWLITRRPGLLPHYDVLSFLDRQLAIARQQRLVGRVIETLLLKALLHQAHKRSLPALEALQAALALGEPEGYTLLFIEVGRDLAPLLRQVIERSNGLGGAEAPLTAEAHDRLIDDARRLLALLEQAAILPAAGLPAANTPAAHFSVEQPALPQSPQPPAGLPCEPARAPVLLSPREIDVLRLLAEGLSNREIAARLYLSYNTVRIHTSNLYAKLEVASRTQAVARGRALGYLE